MIVTIAWRNLWRNKRRTQLTMAAMVFACALLVFSLGYYDGILWSLINNATEKESGHISISRAGYFDVPTIHSFYEISPGLKSQIENNHQIKGFCPLVSSYALLSCGPEGKSKTYPAELIGVDYKAEIKNSRLADLIVQGSFLTGKEHEVILGSGLALRLNARPGDELVLVGNAIDGSLTSELLNVSGIVSTGDQFRDSGLAIMNIDLVQELFLLKKNIHSLRLFLKDPLRTKEVIESLRLADGFEAISWQQSFPQIASLLDLWFGIQIFTMVIYYAALGLITFNTMYMAFIERKFEFAVMRAIGLSKLRLTGLILAESIMIAILSGVIGSLIGTASNFLFFYYPIDFSGFMENIAWGGSIMQIQIYCVPGLVSSLFPFLAMILLGIFVVIFPVCKLYKLHPVEALRDV